MLSWIELDKGALHYNLNQFRKLIGTKKLLMPVLKSNAYGHGFKEVATIWADHKQIDRICVVSLDEALALLQITTKKPILILSFYELEEQKLLTAAKHTVAFPLYTMEQAKVLNNLGKKLGKRILVHLKIDTGTSRIGILPKNAVSFVQEIKKFSFLYLEGLWTHFASSEEDEQYTMMQLQKLHQVDEDLKKRGIVIPLKHAACTASTILYKTTHLDGVRIGLGCYGLHPSRKTSKKINLKPVLSLNTKIVQIKNVPKNTKVGYGGVWVTKKPTRLAIIPIGYFDGYDRKLSNNVEVIIKNKRCALRGRICMNLSIIDVTNIKNIAVGDRVVLLGKTARQQITADELAQKISTINYEIVTRLNPFLPRHITQRK